MFKGIIWRTVAFLLLASPLLHSQQVDSTVTDTTGVVDTTKNLQFAGIPIVNYDRTLGAYFGAMAAIYYRVNRADTISPLSNTGIAGIYTTNNSWFLSAYSLMYLDEDRWETCLHDGLTSRCEGF